MVKKALFSGSVRSLVVNSWFIMVVAIVAVAFSVVGDSILTIAKMGSNLVSLDQLL